MRRASIAVFATLSLAALSFHGPAAAAPTPRAKHVDPSVLALPDIYGPGAVLRAGDVRMKVTNFGHVGNVFTNLSSDPSGQWPDSSGVEYLNGILFAVGAVDFAGSGTHPRRTSYFSNWRPATLGAEDRIYAGNADMINGTSFVNDDNDLDLITGEPLIDEDFLDGRDNDGDGLIDEDFGALGASMFSCVMRDDTPEAVAADPNHIPLGLECRQVAWCESRPGFTDYNVVEYTIINRSGRTLDSLYIGWRVDMDAGPISNSTYFTDDQDLPGFPSGEFLFKTTTSDPRRQFPHHPALNASVSPDSALCPRWPLRVNGFALRDADGDGGETSGAAAFLLVEHTIDPTGASAPERVGFRAFRSFPGGTPYGFGGNPATPEQRYEFMSGTEGIDPSTGFIDVAPGSTPGDYLQWCSVGPFRQFADGASVRATIAFAVQNGSQVTTSRYASDYTAYRAGTLGGRALLAAYPLLRTAFDIQASYDGMYELREGFRVPDFHGRETGIQLPPGAPPQIAADCRDVENGTARIITDREPTWFDMDCDYCTGVWGYPTGQGYFHRTWVVAPPSLTDVAVPDARHITRWTATPNPSSDGVRFEIAFSGSTGPPPGGIPIGVFDIGGRGVREIAARADGGPLNWDLTDDSGRRVGPGLYFCRAATAAGERVVRVAVVE